MIETTTPASEFSQLLERIARRDDVAEQQLLALAYDELRQVARRVMAGERSTHTLSPTALVHEAYLRFSGPNGFAASDRKQFFAFAARCMRQVLIDHARKRDADIRGGPGQSRVTLSALDVTSAPIEIDLLALDQAMGQLEAADARKARVVELRYFAGMEMAEIAELLDISRATAQRDWDVARSYLYQTLR